MMTLVFPQVQLYIFECLNGVVWEEKQKYYQNHAYQYNLFGRSVALDNNYLIIGSPGVIAAYIFKKIITFGKR